MKTAAILLAGGIGKRVGDTIPKQFISILGKPILFYSLEVFDRCAEVDAIYLTLPEEKIGYFQKELLPSFPVSKLKKVIAGGVTRQDSTYNAFRALSQEGVEIVVIHDVARPLIRSDMIQKSIFAARESGAAIVAACATDTIKEVDEKLFVQKTLERKSIYQVQTPQAFQYSLLNKAFEWAMKNSFQATDEATLIEKIGKSVRIVESDPTNLKVTTLSDLIVAESLLKNFLNKG